MSCRESLQRAVTAVDVISAARGSVGGLCTEPAHLHLHPALPDRMVEAQAPETAGNGIVLTYQETEPLDVAAAIVQQKLHGLLATFQHNINRVTAGFPWTSHQADGLKSFWNHLMLEVPSI